MTYTQPKNTAFGFPIELPLVSDDYYASRTRLDELLEDAKVQHFEGHEFGKHYRAEWDGPNMILPEDVRIMLPVIIFADILRTYLGTSLIVGSSFRVAAYNTAEDQSPRSKHLWATALDLFPGSVHKLQRAIEHFTCSDVLPLTQARIAERMRMVGFDVPPEDIRIGWGVYQTFIHIDITWKGQPFARPRTARYQ